VRREKSHALILSTLNLYNLASVLELALTLRVEISFIRGSETPTARARAFGFA